VAAGAGAAWLAVLPTHLREFQLLAPRAADAPLDPIAGAAGAAGAELALTLNRSTGWLSRPDLRLRRGHAGPPLATPGGQEPGAHRFEYAIMPWHDVLGAGFLRAVEQYAYPLAVLGSTEEHALAGGLHLDLEPATMMLSAAAPRADGSVELRFWSAADSDVTATIRMPGLRACSREDLLGRPFGRQPDVSGDTATVTVRPREIVTLALARG
jgi:alpha-mannosidase